ncbi:50S ribosomal protein L25 [Pseudenhygromyxa sp. WMMC2535]|uniref:50S ribosomal protein L25 n=1 Tax=Pseudenhygromyxa sp. WMMC2535 TaxID=2712867 RepID=UPI001555A4A3|nr:50S ribosomal protein L25 [Pseudenhygromyxa sp. WMMC2535]NVB38943.1 50S ribosomal protein L25 [Pseudenhygromyxa sp. WMMC2535]
MTESEIGKLNVQIRENSGKGVARKLRAQGLIPGVLYGKGEGNVMLTISPRELRRAMDPRRKLNTFFTLNIQSGDSTSVEQCVLTDYQADPIRDEFLHVDFLRVDPNNEVVTKIPVEYSGRAVGVVAGGKLRTYQRTVRVSAKPAQIPVKLAVDVTPLQAGQTLRMKDLSLENATLLEHPDVVVATVDPPRAAKAAGADDKKKKK